MNRLTDHLAPAAKRPLSRLPLWVVLLVVGYALAAGCGGSSSTTSNESTPAGGSEPSATAESPAPAEESTEAPMASEEDEAALGAKVYAARCALCHGATGHGDGPAAAGLNPKPRNHTDKAYMSTLTDEQLVAVIRNGKGTMPAWGKVLSDREIQAVAKHVRSLSQ